MTLGGGCGGRSGAVFVSVVGEDADAETLQENWTTDSKGQPQLNSAQYFEAIFELADIWCEVGARGSRGAPFARSNLTRGCVF